MKRVQKKTSRISVQEVSSNDGNAKLQISEAQDQGTLSPSSNVPRKTCAKKDKKPEEIQKSAKPLNIQSFRKRYPLHNNNHTLIRHIVLCKWRASHGKTLGNLP